jgi:hypothetical protein
LIPASEKSVFAPSETERSRLFLVTHADVRGPNSDERVPAVEESVFLYLNYKVQNLPADLFSLGSYDHESGLLSTERVVSSSLKMWAGRLNEPDATVPGRSWSLEFILAEVGSNVTFASRLSCFSRHLDFYFEPAVPRVYKDLVSKKIIYGDGIRLARMPVDITNEVEVDSLLAQINNPKRSRDIIVVACDEQGSCIVNPDAFANRLCLIAHVVRLYPSASFRLSELVGKYFSVFDQGIRIYKPTAQIEKDEPLRHPLYTKRHLSRVNRTQLQSSIARSAFLTSVEGSLRAASVPSFVHVRSAASTFRLAEIQSMGAGTDSLTKLESELKATSAAREAAEVQAREALDLAVQEEENRKQAEQERDQERAHAMAIAARVRHLEKQIALVPSQENRPLEYDDIPDWIEREFAGRMRLHSRALRSLKNARYEDINFVCDLLQLLAKDYVDGRMGSREASLRFETEIENRGVQLSRAISETRAGEQGDEYFVTFRGRRTFLESHLKKGSSRRPEKDLRIYFFWDPEDEEVIVGSLPGHLDTRMT